MATHDKMSIYTWRKVMTLVQLEVFARLAELKSFTLTAKQLDVSQSAISHALKVLEQQWQVQLFYRNNNEVELTAIGYELAVYAKEILNSAVALKQKIADIHDLKTGKIIIGSFGASSSNVLLPMILEKFSRQYPSVEIMIEEGSDKQIAQWIVERKIDIGFVVLPEERFDYYPLIEDTFVALVHKDHVLSKKTHVTLEQLAQFPFLMTAAGSQQYIHALFQQASINPQIKGHFSQILSIIHMVNNQMGVSIVADLALDHHLLKHYPHVVKLPLSPHVKRSIALAVKDKNQISPFVHAFIVAAQSI